jgi:hypothetical protein
MGTHGEEGGSWNRDWTWNRTGRGTALDVELPWNPYHRGYRVVTPHSLLDVTGLRQYTSVNWVAVTSANVSVQAVGLGGFVTPLASARPAQSRGLHS